MITKDKALDFLKAVCTIGSGRIAKALSEMLGVKTELSFPQVEFISPNDLTNKIFLEESFFVIETSLEGDITGRMAFLLNLQDARILGSKLLNKNPQELDIKNLVFQSSLQETVNIFSGTFTSVLSEMTRLNIFYTVPFLGLGSKDRYLGFIFKQFGGSEMLFFMSIMLKVEDIRFRGGLLFLLDYNSIKKLLEALGQSQISQWIENTKSKFGDKSGLVGPPKIEYIAPSVEYIDENKHSFLNIFRRAKNPSVD
ncbi:MAG: chemotaxis protein CheC [Candidatus Omnitrophota bacterium]